MDKLISVVIPTYNRKILTDRAIQSVITASPELIEIIVVDDFGDFPYFLGMPFNNCGVCVRVVRLEKNVGAGMARSVGVDVANAEYICYLDSDDYYDDGWIDYLIGILTFGPFLKNEWLMVSGITNGEKPFGASVRILLAAMPASFRLVASRFVAVFFNPFYTPSILVHRNLCSFMVDLRHCEDYYSNVISIFRTKRILLPNVVACHLGRMPNSAGGQSSASEKMYAGEMRVRRSIMRFSFIPLPYKFLVPVGMLYQIIRSGVKWFVRRVMALAGY